jgi:hypothetical protein
MRLHAESLWLSMTKMSDRLPDEDGNNFSYISMLCPNPFFDANLVTY